MQTFFVPDPSELDVIYQEQFWLVYSGHFDFFSTEHMTFIERAKFLELLLEQKQREAKAIEDAKNKSK